MRGPIQSLQVSYLVHATEDAEKIRGAVARLLGHQGSPETEALKGHFGNAIVKAWLHLTGAEAEAAFNRIVDSMPSEVVAEITSRIESYLDEHSALFVRLDKQRLLSGVVSLGAADPVRVRVKPRTFLMKDGAARFYTRLLRRG